MRGLSDPSAEGPPAFCGAWKDVNRVPFPPGTPLPVSPSLPRCANIRKRLCRAPLGDVADSTRASEQAQQLVIVTLTVVAEVTPHSLPCTLLQYTLIHGTLLHGATERFIDSHKKDFILPRRAQLTARFTLFSGSRTGNLAKLQTLNLPC